MYYEFYIDQFFVEHLLTGCILLSIAVRLGRWEVSSLRIILAGAAGTLVMCALIAAGTPLFYLCGTAVSGIIAFTGKERGGFFWGMLLLLFVTVCFAGTLEALLSLFPLPFLAGIFAAGGVVRGACCFAEYRVKTDATAEVQLFCGKENTKVTALFDSGNRLLEPLTGRPVSIADSAVILPLLEEGWEEKRGFVMLPYHSIGKKQGWMRGVVIDSMKVRSGKSTAVYKRPVIAVYEGQVSAGGQYQMILHPMHAVMEKRSGRKENDSKNSGTAEVSVQDGSRIRGCPVSQNE